MSPIGDYEERGCRLFYQKSISQDTSRPHSPIQREIVTKLLPFIFHYERSLVLTMYIKWNTIRTYTREQKRGSN